MTCKDCALNDTECNTVSSSLIRFENIEKYCKRFKDKNSENKQKPINYFVEMAHLNETPAEILNWYRNCYYKEPDNTERGIVANALNSVLPELARLRELEDKVKKIIGDLE